MQQHGPPQAIAQAGGHRGDEADLGGAEGRPAPFAEQGEGSPRPGGSGKRRPQFVGEAVNPVNPNRSTDEVRP